MDRANIRRYARSTVQDYASLKDRANLRSRHFPEPRKPSAIGIGVPTGFLFKGGGAGARSLGIWDGVWRETMQKGVWRRGGRGGETAGTKGSHLERHSDHIPRRKPAVLGEGGGQETGEGREGGICLNLKEETRILLGCSRAHNLWTDWLWVGRVLGEEHDSKPNVGGGVRDLRGPARRLHADFAAIVFEADSLLLRIGTKLPIQERMSVF